MAIVETDPAFDTLAHVRTLREAGVERKQAEAHAEAARPLRAGLATKADLAVIEARLDTFATKADLNAGLSGLRADIYRVLWMQTGAFVAAVTALIAAFKLFA